MVDNEAASAVTTFAQALRMQRARAGISQHEMSRRSGISVSTLSEYERGERARPPRIDTIRLLERVLDAPRGVLLDAAGYWVERAETEDRDRLQRIRRMVSELQDELDRLARGIE